MKLVKPRKRPAKKKDPDGKEPVGVGAKKGDGNSGDDVPAGAGAADDAGSSGEAP